MCSVALILALGPTVQVMYISYAMKPCGPNCVDTLAHFMGGLYAAYILMDVLRILGLTAGVFTTTDEERNAGSDSVNNHMRKFLFERLIDAVCRDNDDHMDREADAVLPEPGP